MANFENKNGGAPFPRTEAEWTEKGLARGMELRDAQREATHKMRQDVFGHDYQIDRAGAPIERGRGSISNQTPQHLQAKQLADDAIGRLRAKQGWTSALEGAFDPRSAPAYDPERVERALALLAEQEAAQAAAG